MNEFDFVVSFPLYLEPEAKARGGQFISECFDGWFQNELVSYSVADRLFARMEAELSSNTSRRQRVAGRHIPV